MAKPKNLLYYGDNLDVLRRHVAPESVDLVYLDPPFKSAQDYNLLYRDRVTVKDRAQFEAFEDTWGWGPDAEEAYHESTTSGGPASQALVSLRGFLHQSDMMAYLSMMAPRLVELRRVMKPTASIYLHCDPTASHYLKMLMDSVFGYGNFRAEVIWKRASAHSSSKRFSPVHDTLLYYTRSGDYTWNQICQPLPQETADAWYNNVEEGTGKRFNRDNLTASGVRRGSSGKPWRGINPSDKGRHWAVPRFYKSIVGDLDTLEALEALDKAGRIFWPKKKGGQPMLKRYLDEAAGVPALDVITHIPPLNNVDRERIGYPTQKPLALIEYLITASSNRGDVVLDPFCGCGTTIEAAQKLERPWIGIDVTSLAINVVKHRLMVTLDVRVGEHYQVIGEPVDLAGAEQLASEDRHQFEHWALGLVGARASAKRKGADHGIDGRLYFYDDHGEAKQVIVSVKSGKVSVKDLRDLRGVLEREKATLAAFITLHAVTQPMKAEAAAAGFYDSPWGTRHSRLQVLTVECLLNGGDLDRPPTRADLAPSKAGSKPILAAQMPLAVEIATDRRKPTKRATPKSVPPTESLPRKRKRR
jgi:DNA modification methylase